MAMKKFFSAHFFNALFLCTALMVSCTAKHKADNLIENIEDAITKMEKDASKIKKEDWEKYDKQIVELKAVMKINKEEFTPEEVEENNKLIGKYYALKATQKIGDFKNELKNIGQQLEGMYETFIGKDSLEN
jgi:uncharacterized protein YchJ